MSVIKKLRKNLLYYLLTYLPFLVFFISPQRSRFPPLLCLFRLGGKKKTVQAVDEFSSFSLISKYTYFPFISKEYFPQVQSSGLKVLFFFFFFGILEMFFLCLLGCLCLPSLKQKRFFCCFLMHAGDKKAFRPRGSCNLTFFGRIV